MQEIPPNVQHEIQQFQQLEQQYQMVVSQKQKLTIDLKETELALEELEKNPDTVYKSIGSILVKTETGKLTKELEERKENLEVRTGALERQEKRLMEKLNTMRSKIEQMLGTAGVQAG
ncbi:MAG: prefoldin subunit beta [Candidatus Methanofastidiosia archaeon]|jgi:prefoldin beta subunit